MRERLYRTQVLLEPGQQQALSEIAHQQGRSISDLLREIVSDYLNQHGGEDLKRERLSALDRIRSHQTQILERRGGRPLDSASSSSMEKMREERVNDLLENTPKDRD